jgi:hypothetical protein
MALLNSSFEDAGPGPGEATHWQLRTSSSLRAIAGFTAEPEEAWESFERWAEFFAAFDAVASARAFFDGAVEGFEDFEDGYANQTFVRDLDLAQVLPASFSTPGPENFEEHTLATAWDDVSSTAGAFDGEPSEDFEEAWRANELFVREWSSVPAAALGTETFEAGWAPATTF